MIQDTILGLFVLITGTVIGLGISIIVFAIQAVYESGHRSLAWCITAFLIASGSWIIGQIVFKIEGKEECDEECGLEDSSSGTQGQS